MDDKEKAKEKKRQEILKSAKFAEKYFGGLTQEHFEPQYIKKKYQELEQKKNQGQPVDEQELFIWGFLFENRDKIQKIKNKKMEEDDLFPWGFLFEEKNKKKKK